MISMPDQQFLNGLINYLLYWDLQADKIIDGKLFETKVDKSNLFKVIQHGLYLPQTRTAAVGILIKIYAWIDKLSDWLFWLPLFEKAIESSATDKPKLRCQLLIFYGKLLRSTQQNDKAALVHHQALEVAAYMNNSEWLAKAHLQLSDSYRLMKNYDEAEQHGKLAVHLFQELDKMEESLCHTFVTLSLISTERGNFILAERQLQTAFDFSFHLLDDDIKARLLNIMAVILQGQERFEEAEKTFLQSLFLLENSRSMLDLFNVQNSLAALYYNMGRYERAERIYRDLEMRFRHQTGYKFYYTMALTNLGNVLLAQSKLDEAEQLEKASMSQWIQFGDEIHQANATGILAEIYVNQNKLPEAKKLFRKSIILLEKYPENERSRRLQKDFKDQLEAII